jgi:hypothetical protein
MDVRLGTPLTGGSCLLERKKKKWKGEGVLRVGWLGRFCPVGPVRCLPFKKKTFTNFLFSTKLSNKEANLLEKNHFFCKIQVNQNSTAGDIELQK